jgi:methylmalonyl-CoA mutase N-terminal domain/subunit
VTDKAKAGHASVQLGIGQQRLARESKKGERTVVGVNKFAVGEPPEIDLFEVPESTTERQIEKLREVRAARDAGRVSAALEGVAQAAAGDANLMPPIIDAVRAYATVGEICRTLAKVFGEYAGPGS